MRNTFKLIGIIIIVVFFIQIFSMYNSDGNIPKYSYQGLDGKYYNHKQLPKSPIVFVYFSTECGFCEKAIVELLQLHKRNSEVNFVLITNEKNRSIIKTFVSDNKINELTSFIYIDAENSFPTDFGLGMVYTTPTILAYNSSGKFVKEINYKDLATLEF